ncbi:MAG: hypothetical protein FJ276_01590 [Planctomycetes bacterium]|nr:hypothetical protein [Planctomycetota bacterium]
MLDQQMLDLLVDGELTDDQERALLFELSRTPDGWQQCALAFLEARCWHRGFAGLQRQSADVSRTVVRKPAARERNVPGWAWTLMLAGVFVLAFGVGSFLPRPWSRSPGNQLAGPANVPATIDLAGHSRAPSDPLPWQQLVQPRHDPIGNLTLVDNSVETVKVPVYDWDLAISVIRKADKPVAITVTRGEQRWDVDEKSLDKLPNDIRPHLERMFGRGVSVSIGPPGVGWMGAGCMITGSGLKGTPTATTWDYQDWYMFGSSHPQKVLFTFADGAVRAVDEDINTAVFVYISGMRDGRVVNTGDIAE